MNATTHRFSLERTSKKFPCPHCGKKEFVRYKNNEAGDYIAEHVGRCDRESSCGYHYTPKEYFKEKGVPMPPAASFMQQPTQEPQPIDCISHGPFYKTFAGYWKSHFATYLTTLFGADIARATLLKYLVGRSRLDNGKASIFWRIDIDEKIRTGKIILYNPDTGKRRKDVNPTWVHAVLKPFNYQLCFFGEHLLAYHSNKPVAIVESEKTAIIASIYMPSMVWLATGGASGCKWREYAVHKVLKNRDVILFPDYGLYNKQSGKTCYQEWKERADRIAEVMPCTIKVSRILEDKLAHLQREDHDLADLLIKRDGDFGLALTDEGYPVNFRFVQKHAPVFIIGLRSAIYFNIKSAN